MSAAAAFLSAAILALLAWRTRSVMRAERGRPEKGCAPGEGVATIRAEYSSGIGGGGAADYTVSRDPQAYARLFVPKTKQKG